MIDNLAALHDATLRLRSCGAGIGGELGDALRDVADVFNEVGADTDPDVVAAARAVLADGIPHLAVGDEHPATDPDRTSVDYRTATACGGEHVVRWTTRDRDTARCQDCLAASEDVGDELREVNALIARDPGMSLRARYDDDRPILIAPSHNREITLQIGDQDQVFVDALDLLRVVSHVALELVYGPSPTELERVPPGSADS